MTGIRSLIVPGSLTSETADPRVATYKIGLIGRAAAIFGVDEIVVYEDPAHKDGRRVSRVLQYQATAPYLRKRLFPISQELSHVGVLPPLNLPLHLVDPQVRPGQVRFGALVGDKVDIGLRDPVELVLGPEDEEPESGEQFPVVVQEGRRGRTVVSPYTPAPGEHLAYRVERAPSLSTALRDQDPILGTSRQGKLFSKEHLEPEGVALVFGSPEKGVEEMLNQPPSFPLVNTIPDQATKTVRVEEAVFCSLGLIHGAASGLPASD